MKNLIFFSICVSLCLIYSCNGSKEIITEQEEQSFIIGSGGGVTGAYETYRISNHGTVEQQNSDMSTFSFLKELHKDSVQIVFSELDELNIGSLQINHPGNMTYFITLNGNTITWGASDYTIRKDIDAFFKRIRKMIRAK